MKIGIIGMGAIGGYIGSLLCRSDNEVYIFTSGKMLKHISQNGITLKSEIHGEFTAFPKIATSRIIQSEKMDIIFVCVKGLMLKKASDFIKHMIDEYTLVIPIIDGVEIADKLYKYLKKGQILETAHYMRVWCENAGVYVHRNNTTRFIISSPKKHPVYDINLNIAYEVMNRAGIKCEIGYDTEAESWNKYVFDCAFNITDSYYDVGVKGILEDRMKFETFCNIARECESVGREKGIKLHDNVITLAVNRLKKLSKKSMSSMHKDIIFGRKFELELYCGDLCRMGKSIGIATPYCTQAYKKLRALQPA